MNLKSLKKLEPELFDKAIRELVDEYLWTKNQIVGSLGVHRTWVYRHIDNPNFPKPELEIRKVQLFSKKKVKAYLDSLPSSLYPCIKDIEVPRKPLSKNIKKLITENFWTKEEMANFLKVSRSWIDTHAREKEFPSFAFKIERVELYNKAKVEKYISGA